MKRVKPNVSSGREHWTVLKGSRLPWLDLVRTIANTKRLCSLMQSP
jgi:hypothetical protein